MRFITLLSDLGDYSAGVAKTKSILLQRFSDVNIIDVTHNIFPFYLQEASYLLASTINDFPAGTIHVVLFDLYYTDKPVLVLAKINDQYVLAPDNGILPLALGNNIDKTWKCCSMDDSMSLSVWINNVVETIQQQVYEPNTMQQMELYELQNAPFDCKAIIYPDYAECFVIHIDRFENVVLNITKEEFEAAAKGRAFSIDVIRNDTITAISNNYNSVSIGEKLCRFNSAGYLEIAINKGNAAGLFGIKMVREKLKPHNTIKIKFE